MKLDKTTTLLIISCILWFLSIVMLFSSASKHNKEIAAMQANRELITKELSIELTESAKYDSITKELSAQSGTQYYALVNYLKSLRLFVYLAVMVKQPQQLCYLTL